MVLDSALCGQSTVRPPNWMKESLISSGEGRVRGGKHRCFHSCDKHAPSADCTHCSAQATTGDRPAVECYISGLSNEVHDTSLSNSKWQCKSSMGALVLSFYSNTLYLFPQYGGRRRKTREQNMRSGD